MEHKNTPGFPEVNLKPMFSYNQRSPAEQLPRTLLLQPQWIRPGSPAFFVHTFNTDISFIAF